MSFCRITNLIPTSVAIEDIGVHLPCRGSHVIVDADSVARSRDIDLYRKWIHIEPCTPARFIPIWPFVKPIPSVDPLSPVPVVQESTKPSQELAEMRNMLNTIAQRIQTMTDLLAQKAVSPESIHQIVSSVIQAPPASDPLFIPSKIMPQSAEVHINIQENETMRDDVDVTVQALRNLRKSP